MSAPDPNATVEVPEAKVGRLAQFVRDNVPPDPPWLVPGMIAPGSVTELNGREKSGKGFFENYLIGALEREGETILGPSAHGPARTLIYTEEPEQSLKEKFDLFDISQAMVVYQWELGHLPWTEVVPWLTENAVRLECKLIFIDNISAATQTTDEFGVELANKMRPLASKAKELDLAVLYDRHQRKQGGKVEDLSRGSTSLAGAVDVIVAMQKDGKGRERKLTSWGRLMATNWEKQVELHEDWTGYTLLDGDYRQRRLFERDEWTAREFGQVIQVSDDTARSYLDESPYTTEHPGAGKHGATLYTVIRPPELS